MVGEHFEVVRSANASTYGRRIFTAMGLKSSLKRVYNKLSKRLAAARAWIKRRIPVKVRIILCICVVIAMLIVLCKIHPLMDPQIELIRQFNPDRNPELFPLERELVREYNPDCSLELFPLDLVQQSLF